MIQSSFNTAISLASLLATQTAQYKDKSAIRVGEKKAEKAEKVAIATGMHAGSTPADEAIRKESWEGVTQAEGELYKMDPSRSNYIAYKGSKGISMRNAQQSAQESLGVEQDRASGRTGARFMMGFNKEVEGDMDRSKYEDRGEFNG